MAFKHVLLVEDNIDNQFIFRKALRQIDPTAFCSIASDGEDAMEQLQTIHPDIIFADINLPPENGIELLTRMKKIPHHAPVILVSTSREHNDNKRFDAQYLFVKPVFLNKLCYHLESLLKGRLGEQLFPFLASRWQMI
jgi:two-component system, NarL family, nitrate/nitrite response regulator NarL